MIQSVDLRIGNWVQIGTQSTPHRYKIEQILLSNVIAKSDFYNKSAEVNYEDVFPIPLQVEILRKSKFENVGPKWYAPRNSALYLLESESKQTPEVWIFHSPEKRPLTSLLYAHQLQNIYFDLTGKELEMDIG